MLKQTLAISSAETSAVDPEPCRAPNGVSLIGLSYVAGPTAPLAEWCLSEGLDGAAARQLALGGIRSVARRPDDGRLGLAECIAEAVARAGFRPDDIAALCFAPPSFEWSRTDEAELFDALATSGFLRLPVIGVGLQGCGAIGAVVEVASGLAQRRQRPVLIVLSALPRGDARFDARSTRLFGYGAACAVLAPGDGAFRLLAAAGTSDIGLAQDGLSGGKSAGFQETWQLLRAVIADLLAAAQSEPGDVAFVCGSNVNTQALTTIAMAAGVPHKRVWAGGLAELGHLYSADALISLALLEASGKLRRGDKVLVVGWSQWTVSGIVVEYFL